MCEAGGVRGGRCARREETRGKGGPAVEEHRTVTGEAARHGEQPVQRKQQVRRPVHPSRSHSVRHHSANSFPIASSPPRRTVAPRRGSDTIASHRPLAAQTTDSTPWTVRRVAHAAIGARSTPSITDRSYLTKSRGACPRRGTHSPAATPGSRASGPWAHAGPTASSPGRPTASAGPGRRRASRRARPGAGPRPA